MKLTAQQITYIENYIKSFDIKYYEVYMEILDHMILSVEAILEENNSISFEEAVVQAKNEGFGKKGFRGMMNEKMKLANKQATNENNKRIKEYFTFPKIVLTITVFILYYLFLLPFENPLKVNLIALCIISFLGIIQLFYSWKYRKINEMNILKTQVLNSRFFMCFMGMHVTSIYVNIGKDTIDFNHFLMRLFMSLIFTFSLLSLLAYIEIRKQTIEELKTQIFV